MKLFAFYPALLFSFLIWGTVFSSGRSDEEGLHFVHLKAANVQERSEIARYIHIDQIIEDDVYATVNEQDLNALKSSLGDRIVTTHSLSFDSRTSVNFIDDEDFKFPTKDEAYHTYDEVREVLHSLAERYPHIVELTVLGKTVEEREIPMIRLTHRDNRDGEFFTPGILFVGSHHAREHLSTEIPLLLAKHLAENYDSDEKIKRLINTRDIYIVPILNVDGKLHDIKGGRYKSWRKNRSLNDGSRYRGVDLNRNYSYRWGKGGSSKRRSSNVYRGPAPFSEPETTAIKTFIESHSNIFVLLSYHTYSELILYPWGGSYDGIGGEDQKVFKKMANDMAQWTNYKPMQASSLYIATGDTCDWAYGEHGIYCFTFELTPRRKFFSGGFYPGPDVIQGTFRANLEPALYLMEYSAGPSRVLNQN